MSISSEITRIQNKRDLSFAEVANKGVTVPAGSTIDDLPGLIAQIEQGSGSGSGGIIYQDLDGYLNLSEEEANVISIVDTLDTAGGTVRTITGAVESGTGSSGLYASGSITIITDTEVPTTGMLIPGIQLPFQPDIFELWMDKDSYFAITAPANNHFYHILFTKSYSTMPPQRYNATVLYDRDTSGYIVAFGTGSYTFSGTQNGYALNTWNTLLAPTYADGFGVNANGTIKVSSTNNTFSFYAGTYHYVAYGSGTS